MQKQSIAIVEDEILIANDTKRTLLNFGYTVYGIYTSGESLLSDLHESVPDLILLDINLGQEMSGIDLSQIISQKYNIPIIFATAFSDSETVEAAIKNSPYGYILKPFTDATLFTTINVVFSRIKLEKELRKSRDRYRRLTDLLPLSVLELNAEGQILFFNKYAKEYFQRDDNAISEGKLKLSDYFVDKHRFYTFINSLQKKGEIELKVIDKDGIKKASLLIMNVQKGEEKKFFGVIIDFADITNLQKQEIQLEKLNATAHIISKFNSELGHYLLNSLDLLSTIIKDNTYEIADIKLVETNVKNALELINSLDIFISEKELVPSFENINNILIDIAKTIMFSLRYKNIKFGCNCEPLLPDVFIDKNAIKYAIMFLSNIVIEKLNHDGEFIFRTVFKNNIIYVEIQFRNSSSILSVKKDISFRLADKIVKMQNGSIETEEKEDKNIIRISLPII